MSSVKSTWPEILHGLENELTSIERMARQVDLALASTFIEGGKPTNEQRAVFQEMDILIQTVEDIRNFAARLSEQMPDGQSVEIGCALEVLRLDRVVNSFSQVKHDKKSYHGQVTLF